MKKVLIATMLVLLFAGSAYAQATFSMTGSYWAEGKYWVNYNANPGTDATYNESGFGFYEQDIILYPKITVGDSSLNLKVSMTDTEWGKFANPGSTHDLQHAYLEDDDNIAIERAFITNKLNDVFTLDVGLMDGTVWGTSFADDKTGRWRVKLTAKTAIGAIGGILEKIDENGSEGMTADAENNDSDNAALFMVTKVGNVFIKPLLYHVDTDGILAGKDFLKREYFSLAFNGDLGGMSFESELNYNDYRLTVDALGVREHFATQGYYLNLWKAMESMTPGITLAYGSYNKKAFNAISGAPAAAYAPGIAYISGVVVPGATAAVTAANAAFTATPNATTLAAVNAATAGLATAQATLATTQATAAATTTSLTKLAAAANFDFDDDFNSTVILGDEFGWGGNGDDLQGMTLVKLYVNNIKTGVAPLTLSGYAAYVSSNQKDTLYEDATAWEVGIGASYKISDNLVYTPYASYADMNYDSDLADDPKGAYILANAIEFAF